MFLGRTGFGKFVDIVHRGMAAVKYRYDVTANNIVNAETPNFKRSVVNFESHLQEALDSEKDRPWFNAARTHKGHVSFYSPVDYRTITPKRVLDWQTQVNNNGNNVSLEQEKGESIKAAMSYQLLTESMSAGFQRLNIVLR